VARARFFLRACVRNRLDRSEMLGLVHDLLEAEGLQEPATCLVARWDPIVSELTDCLIEESARNVDDDLALLLVSLLLIGGSSVPE